jgi:hypothetical protein
MANMATDSWLPHRFSALSERLTMRNGVLLMGGAARSRCSTPGGRLEARGAVLDQRLRDLLALEHRDDGVLGGDAAARSRLVARHLPAHVAATLLCVTILGVTVFEKFGEGGG